MAGSLRDVIVGARGASEGRRDERSGAREVVVEGEDWRGSARLTERAPRASPVTCRV